jgi:hypothetical protein
VVTYDHQYIGGHVAGAPLPTLRHTLRPSILRDVHEITLAIGAQIVVRLARSDLSKSAGVLVVHRAFAK